MNNKLLTQILEVRQLPSLPVVALQVLELAKKKDSSFQSIAKVISSDPALSAKVLKTVNSSFYGVSQPVRTINHALVLLGMQTIKTIALGFSLVRGLNSKASNRFDYVRFWRQSLFAAVASRALAKITNSGDCEEAFLAGLLSDIGTLAMHLALGESYDALLQQCQGDQIELVRMSRQTFDLDHADVGAGLAEKWKFPNTLIEPIRKHHQSATAPVGRTGLVEVTHAGVLCAQIFAAKKTGLIPAARRELATVFRLPSGRIADLLKQIDFQSREMAELFEVKIDPGRSYQDIEEEARQTLIEMSLDAQMQAQQALNRNKELMVEANTDGLTGLSNRRHLSEFLAETFGEAIRAGGALSVLLLDFDRFKSINDTHGHQAGDAVLENVGRMIKSMIAADALAARYGGEEIAIVLRRVSATEAFHVAEQIRKAIATTPILFDDATIKVTVSFGIATMDQENPFSHYDELIGAADRALYAAKEGGRNCCRTASSQIQRGAA